MVGKALVVKDNVCVFAYLYVLRLINYTILYTYAYLCSRLDIYSICIHFCLYEYIDTTHNSDHHHLQFYTVDNICYTYHKYTAHYTVYMLTIYYTLYMHTHSSL